MKYTELSIDDRVDGRVLKTDQTRSRPTTLDTGQDGD